MDNDALLQQVNRLILAATNAQADYSRARGVQAQVCEFLRKFSGPKSSFYEMARLASGISMAVVLTNVLENYRSYVQAGLSDEIAPLRRAQIDVVRAEHQP